MTSTIYTFSADDYAGNTQSLYQFKNKVLLIVNTASACGFTPQYQGLQALYDKYKDQGLEVLAFPCNQFRQQEKANNQEIKQFCDLNFNIRFPLFAKIAVNGPDAHPLYKYLKEQAPGLLGSRNIKWNFTKFLVARDGTVVDRYAPFTKPEAIEGDIKKLL